MFLLLAALGGHRCRPRPTSVVASRWDHRGWVACCLFHISLGRGEDSANLQRERERSTRRLTGAVVRDNGGGSGFAQATVEGEERLRREKKQRVGGEKKQMVGYSETETEAKWTEASECVG